MLIVEFIVEMLRMGWELISALIGFIILAGIGLLLCGLLMRIL